MLACTTPAPDQTPAAWYLALRAADRFHAMHGRYPGTSDGTVRSQLFACCTLAAWSFRYCSEGRVHVSAFTHAARFMAVQLQSDATEVAQILAQVCSDWGLAADESVLSSKHAQEMYVPARCRPHSIAMLWLLAPGRPPRRLVGVCHRSTTLSCRSHLHHAVRHCSTRYGASELQIVAAFMGGVAAQECVKLIAKQYTPLNNTFVYNAIACCSAVMEL